ncbi:uncharacterized protein I303_101118 [Kwoniella dejecticola CBS 10117]|uniref:Uncharacterized protein n=1 Tax=Kwoniella dejecticola CBS 10117 TaxID=1296121 RepID=A0A1A6AGV1_9TREE|nr:uncharacterized protein I303_01122 [Kwoniella dejecticola CBS 10117]OBR89297.1 hypothetical protein I303_01122 [Kwoniella dejecticola CBS 10117]
MSSGMYETTVGSLSLRKLDYSYPGSGSSAPIAHSNSIPSPFTDTLIFRPTAMNTTNRSYSPRQSTDDELVNNSRTAKERSSPPLSGRVSNHRNGKKEELESEDEFLSVDEEMDELSDSKSSHTSSRPVTPSHQAHAQAQAQPHVQIPASRFRSASPPGAGSKSTSPDGIFALAHKAERILGLVPGTLGYAKACLENAKDEIKRLSESQTQTPSSEVYLPYDHHITNGHPTGPGNGAEERGPKKNKMQSRARKAMSFTGFPNYHAPSVGGGGKVPNVVLGLGNKEEEERREKRRKAADGIVYWQREIDRLEREERERMGRS